MKVTNKIKIYLDDKHLVPPIDVMQGDTNTRVLEFSLYEGGSEWPVPAGASVAVAYRRADGRKGIYDTLADGSVAYTVAGNVVTVTLVPQALAVPGNTAATVVFTDTSGGQLATFCAILRVERNPAIGAVEPEDYYNLRQMIAAEVESLLDGVSVTGGGGSAYYFNVSSNGSSYASDKAFAELLAAYNKKSVLYCVLNNNLVLALVNKNSGNMVFQSINDRRYFRVTITSEDTVIAATDDYALLTEVPDKLPNPNALTINGKTYDGSDPVNITISGGDASENILIGQTPFELTENSNVKLVGSGTHSYTVKGKTVADLSTMTVTSTNATLTEYEDHIEIVAGEAANWYGAHVTLTVKGLTVGKTYVCVIDQLGLDTANLINNGYYMVKNSSGTELARMGDDTTGLNSVEFTPDTSDITIVCYPCNNYYWGENYRTARIGDLYINEAADGTQRTDVINETGTFNNAFSLGKVSAGVTITTEPSCEVYSIIAGNSAAALPLTGKTVVCFGDSLFGMYRGDTSAPAYVAQKTGATVHNVGFGGCRMSAHPTSGYAAFSMWALAKAIAQNNWTEQDAQAANGSSYFPDQLTLVKSIDFSQVDAIVIHYGTNDFTAGSTGVAIDNAEKPQDVNTLCGAMRYSITALLTAYPHLRIFVSVPAFRYWTAEDGTITYSDTYANGNGNKLTDFVDAIANTAKEYNLPIIDSYYSLGINKINAATFLGDGVHHNEVGRKRFGEYIGSCMIARY